MEICSAVKKVLLVTWCIVLLSILTLYFVGGDQLYYASVDTGDMVQATNETTELVTNTMIEQPFVFEGTKIDSIWLYGTDHNKVVGGILRLEIVDDAGKTIANKEIDMAQFSSNNPVRITMDSAVSVTPNRQYWLRLQVVDGSEGGVPSLYYGSSISLSRGELQLDVSESEKVTQNGVVLDGVLCYQIEGERSLIFGQYYWCFACIAIVLLGAYSIYLWRSAKQGKNCLTLRVIVAAKKYKFLLYQLVARDFKSKYKRSVLGILWSFLNPMLMMTVQYVVFSTIFKSEIENFAVYLLSGIVCYNFFSEVTNMALTSIVGNASLITKVYIPKYIYPISRACSSLINFGLSLIPLLCVMLVTRTPLTIAVALLPFGIVCLFMLALGIGMILASSMVFFRDTQFLWNVFNMIWMYMTPIFYPETIISGWLSVVFKANPLYHVIRFFRVVLLNGVSPEPKAYLFCFIASAIPFVVGAMVFKRTQDRFVLYL